MTKKATTKVSMWDYAINGNLTFKGISVPVEWAVHSAKDRVLFRSLPTAPVAMTGVIYMKDTPTITKGGGYMTTKGRDGAALGKASLVKQFPPFIKEIAQTVYNRLKRDDAA
jgi:hypothetical protein